MTKMTMRPARASRGSDAAPGSELLLVSHELALQRVHVLRRLLTGGISRETLHRILPEWTELIDETAASLDR